MALFCLKMMYLPVSKSLSPNGFVWLCFFFVSAGFNLFVRPIPTGLAETNTAVIT
jgi:hypothetical protein